MITYKELEKKIRKAALNKYGRLQKQGNREGAEFILDYENYFFSQITELISQHLILMDGDGFIKDCKKDINEKLERANKRIIEIIRDLGIKHQKESKSLFASKTINKLLHELHTEIRIEMERCLKTPVNRMKVSDADGNDILNKVVCINPNSTSWKVKENILIKKIVSLYNECTALKDNELQIAFNLSEIFRECNVLDMDMEALRKRISRI